MNSHPSPIVVVLSQSQAYALLEFLEDLRNDDPRDQELVTVSQRLSDSFWLARWSRKDVSLELNAETARDLSEGLTASLAEKRWTDDQRQTLEAIAPRLSMTETVAVGCHC